MKMNVKRLVFWVTVLAFVALGSQTGQAQSIQVRVLDGHSGKRISNEKVSVLIKGEKGAREYKTDDEGDFTLPINPSADIFVATEWRVTCRAVKPGVIPFVSVTTILQEGVTLPNTCGHAESETIKGKLVIFTRKASFFENFKR
ncbi:MAG TPA: hypothetical protein VFU55_14350 [Terracidiphilus sp.]|nr:hypothetical protein [Terracidiphilus sp.]